MSIRLSRMVTACFAITLGGSFQPLLASESYEPQVGTVHADITLPSIESREAVSLSSLRGKKVLLIHFASW